MEIQEPKLIDAKPARKYAPNRRIKSTVCMLLFVAFIVYRFTFTAPITSCINDAYHNFSLAANRDLVQEPGPAFEGNSNQLTVFGRAFIGMGQVLMDLWIAIMATIWLLKTHNLRVMAGVALFYLIRGIIFLNLMKFPYPANLAWRSPGFFSVTVPYDHTRDFFFSGHCGGLSVVMAEMFALRLIKTGALAVLALLYMANMLLTTQVHYSIDIIAGILFGLWFFRFSTRYTQFFDRVLSLPLVAGRKVAQCLSKQEEESEAGGSEIGTNAQGEKQKKGDSQGGLQDESVKPEVILVEEEE